MRWRATLVLVLSAGCAKRPAPPSPEVGVTSSTVEVAEATVVGRVLDADLRDVYDVDALPDGALLVVDRGQTVRVLDGATGALRLATDVDDAQVAGAAPDGRRAVAGVYELLVGLDLATGARTWTQPLVENPRDVAWSPDGAWFVLASSDHAERRDAATGAVVWTATLPPVDDPGAVDTVTGVAVTPDGRRVLWTRHDVVEALDAATGAPVAVVGRHVGHVSRVAAARDGTVVAGGFDAAVTAWRDGTAAWTVRTGAWIASVAVDPTGRLAAAVDLDGHLLVLDVADGRSVLTADLADAAVDGALAWSADGRTLWATTTGTVVRFEVPPP